MKRLFDNLVTDLIAAVLMGGMVATGYVLRFPLPPGSNKYLTLWGLTRHQWGHIHFWISLALLGVILLHVVLHWQWIVISVKRKLSARAASRSTWFNGLLTLLSLGAMLILFGWAAHRGVREITEASKEVCSVPASDGTRETGRSDVSATITFWKDVYPVLERSCLSCHGPGKQRGDFRVDQREDFFGNGRHPPLIVPGKSRISRLIAIVSGQKRGIPRADLHRLSDEQVELLRVWIDAGASWPERLSSTE